MTSVSGSLFPTSAALVDGCLVFLVSPTHCCLHGNFDFAFLISCSGFSEFLYWEPNRATYCLASAAFWYLDAWLQPSLLLQLAWIQNQNPVEETTNFGCQLQMLFGPLLLQLFYPFHRRSPPQETLFSTNFILPLKWICVFTGWSHLCLGHWP